MTTIRLILGDQLSASISSLRDIQPGDTVMLCEVMEEASYVPHHPQKIAFIFSAMRHFAAELEAKGIAVRYITLDDAQNTGSFTGEIMRAMRDLQATILVVTEPGEYRVLLMMQEWARTPGLMVEIRDDDRFFCSRNAFRQWAGDKKQLRMEFFYREMRRQHGILLTADGNPIGGAWNYDKENRKAPDKNLKPSARLTHQHSSLTADVLRMVATRFKHHYGRLDTFGYAVTRADALQEFHHFITHYLPLFGDYQDAMVAGDPYLYHARISAYLNIGLLLPREICHRVEQAYHQQHAPLNAVEGFIRQILGWREYVRGIYWHNMPHYGTLNALNATLPLPEFYWTGKTQMKCMAESIQHTMDHAYSHHIQRLMVTGNFALLAGLDVQQVQDWYLAVYSDAYEWVEMPNTLGMALFGDGGIMASKPYAASGKYIKKMSNYCQGCRYNPDDTLGKNACPFNSLYWDFIARHQARFAKNMRMVMIVKSWQRMAPEKQQAILTKAQSLLNNLAAC